MFISYLRVGKLLYWSLLLFVLESYWYGWELLRAIEEQSTWRIVFWAYCFLFSFIHIFLVIMDGWSRFQNYRKAKDQLYEFGFSERLANLYIGSKCQRMAALVAAEELGMKDKLNDHYSKIGVKWYHYVPYFMIKDPLFLFRKRFWRRTFLEKNYTPKYNFKALSLQYQMS